MPTKIEWCMNPDGTQGEVWNPVTGCSKVSQGCRNCYAETIAKRFWGGRKFSDVQIHPERLDAPMHWRKPRRVFVNSMSDLFHEDVPDEFIWRVFDTMTRGNRRHTYMILTKRPARMKAWFEANQERFWHYHAPGEPQREYVTAPWPDPCIWLGVSVENQQAADERIPLLLQTPAAVRFVSCEPLLGPVQMSPQWMYNDHGWETLDWVIAGGESGPGARPMHPDWARSLRDQCQAAGMPFFFKQHGEWLHRSQVSREYQGDLAMMNAFGTQFKYHDWDDGSQSIRVGKKAAGRLLDGQTYDQFPEPRS